MVAREDPALGDLAREVLEERRQRLPGHAAGHPVVDVDLPIPHREGILRARVLEREVDLELEPLERPRERGPHLGRDGLGAHARPAGDLRVVEDLLVDHAPPDPAVEHLPPLPPERAPLRVVRVVPAADLLEQRPLREMEVGVEVLPEVPREDDAHRRAEDLLEVEVDGARRPVVVDVRVHVEARGQEHDERLGPAPVERQALRREEAVVDDPVEVRPHRDAAHVGVPEHVVEVVRGVDPGEHGLQEREPARIARRRLRVGLPHEVADPLGLDRLAGGEHAVGAPPEPADRVPELLPDDPLADQLVGEVDVGQEVVVEEVPERPVAHVVEEPGHAEELLHERGRGGVGEDGPERRPELLREAAGDVHRAEGVRKAAVLRGGEHPARRLELRDPPEALHPGRVDQVLLGRLAGDEAVGPRVEEVPVDRIDDEALAAVGLGARHVMSATRARPGSGPPA